jgi:hypothetical protein
MLTLLLLEWGAAMRGTTGFLLLLTKPSFLAGIGLDTVINRTGTLLLMSLMVEAMKG